ncbi:MAG TPA: aminodeoxychorismate/anthranilate synthase component II [Gemmatimonadales bacterium]|nr:aminodeoxychorismate/anthranilate synthase component II [Gemmatimonadales bacterium]
MILLIDNYDSFVYNLARYVRELGEVPLVRRHDAMTAEDVLELAPSHVIISPGPCSPAEAGISTEVVRRVGATIPVLGVCLGHQCIGAAYGAEIVRAGRPMHGKTSRIHHRGTDLFHGLPAPFLASRYHSLVISPESVPPELEVTATSEDGEIMAVRHTRDPVYGVQFHPESVLTEHGYWILDHFIHGAPSAGRELPPSADRVMPARPWESPPLAAAPPPADLVR